MKKKVVGIVTSDRPDFFQKCIASVPLGVETLVVNDGDNYPILSNYNVIHNQKKKGVGASKNIALKYFYNLGYEHIFLIEDDIVILDENVFDEYIYRAKINGLSHLSYGLSSKKNPLLKKGKGLSFYKNSYAGFSYFKRDVIDKVGYFDECFFNALEHIDYTLRISLSGMHPHPPFYADIENSDLYLANVEENFKGSVIRKDYPLFKKWLKESIEYFIEKWKVHPAKISSVNWMEWNEFPSVFSGAVKNT